MTSTHTPYTYIQPINADTIIQMGLTRQSITFYSLHPRERARELWNLSLNIVLGPLGMPCLC